MKKKYFATSKDKKDWISYTKNLANIYDKDIDATKQNITTNSVRKLDLHGFSVEQANKIVKKFIIESVAKGFKKLLIITGKGLRSKTHNNPYLSENMNILRNSVPEFIKNDEDLSSIINKISTASLKDGGEGAYYIFLRKRKNL